MLALNKLYVDPKTRVWVSHCPVLNITSQGNTESEALAALWSARKLFLKFYVRRWFRRSRSQ